MQDCSSRKDITDKPVMVLCQRLSAASHLDIKGRVMMGRSKCDDGEKGIQKDLGGQKAATTCTQKKVVMKEGVERREEQCEEVDKGYVPNHVCMDQDVDYSDFGRIPTHGPHRPNWAKFGEYSYLPLERYQHNLEHGCVVLLYHPCLVMEQIVKLKQLVSGCLRKHIITSSRIPTLEAPVILLAWGSFQEFQVLDLEKAEQFIRKHALSGPEGNYTKDGLYTHLLTRPATILKKSDEADSVVCPEKSDDRH